MSKKKANPKGGFKGPLLGLLVIGAMGAGALSTFVVMGPGREVPADQRRTERLPEHQEPKPAATRKPAGEDVRNTPPRGVQRDLDDKKVTVLNPKSDAEGNLQYDQEDRNVDEKVGAIRTAINGFLRSENVAPKEAELVKANVKDGLLTLEFNEAFDTTYGTEDERTIVDGILRTAGQWKAVKQVKFTIMGRDLETLGSIELIDPLPVLRP